MKNNRNNVNGERVNTRKYENDSLLDRVHVIETHYKFFVVVVFGFFYFHLSYMFRLALMPGINGK